MGVDDLVIRARVKAELGPLDDMRDEVGDLRREVDDLGDTAARTERQTRSMDGSMRRAGTSGSRLAKISGTVKRGLAAAAVAAGAAAIAVGRFGFSAIKAASDQGEALNKSNVIFGKNAGVIDRWSRSTAKSLGISRTEALSAASTFGDMFSQIGFGLDESTKLSRNVVELSADLGSFHNLQTADVLERIGAAFRGEYDSIQALIPNINAARVEQVALAKTGKESAKELTAQDKAAAALSVIFKDSAAAQGDFARTSDSLANRTKILNAQWQDLKATIGDFFLPIAARVVGWMSGTAVPAVERFVDALKGGGGLGGGGGTLGTFMRVIGDNARDLWGVFQDVWGGIRDGWASLTDSFRSANREHGPMFRKLIGWMGDLHREISDVLGPTLGWLARVGLAAVGRAFERWGVAIKAAGNVFFDLSQIVLGVVGPTVGAVGDLVTGVIDHLLTLAEAADSVPGVDMRGTIEALEGIKDKISSTTTAIELGTASWKAKLEESQWEWNLTERQAARLENRIRLLPDDVETRVTTPGSIESWREMRRLHRAYDLTPTEVVTTIQATGWQPTLRQIRALNRQYDFTPREVGTLVKASGTKVTIGELKKVLKQANITSAKDIQVVLKTLGVDLSVKEFKNVKDEGVKLDKYTAKPKVATPEGAAGARDTINGVRQLLIDLDGNRADTYTYNHVITTHENRGAGDTHSRRGYGAGNLGKTVAAHHTVAAALGGGYQISNALVGGGGRGHGSGDHQAGRAVDVVGRNLPAYAREVRRQGGYAAIHGQGSGKHVHAVMGDTSTPRRPSGSSRGSGGGRSFVFGEGSVQIIVQNPSSDVDVERAVRHALAAVQREAEELED